MRVEFTVCESAGRWRVKWGATSPLICGDFDKAVRAAENLARAAAERGEKGVVTILRDGDRRDTRIFAPEGSRGPPRTVYEPEQDWRNVPQARPA
ncbi:hypothetical protein GGQ61_000012 [Phenylobacterium haematophilum]|uniref:DUF2188 domain-containing protein n=1 Tax=Phenylobacterium haematophilum TaxID=98513 RepID=A0A839ZSD7_9CAUL|nr:hypothetical protein [Phenylobacterium haematophilum]